MPQLIFSKLGIAEEYNVRVALYVLATGVTDPEKICADLKLRSRISAESALSFWPVRGFSSATTRTPRREQSLCSCPHDLGGDRRRKPHRPMISSLIDCAQTGFAAR